MTTRPGIDGPGLPGGGDERGRSGLRRTAGGRSGDVALAPGTIVAGRYRIGAVIGEGGMGIVYRAEQIAMRRPVALKVMHAADGAATTSARFEREAQAASRITSPHVVTIHDFGEGEGGLFYLAMELLHGESLSQRILRGGALSVAESVAITIQIARALATAHAAGVIHRDLKPDNIHLVTDDSGAGLVKVLDFGIARIVHGDQGPIAAHLTSTDLVVGTPLYMSPEACSRGQIGPGADLYSLGVILFEMLTGKPPFDEREPVLLMGRHLEMRPPRVRERRPDLDIPEALDEIVDRMLRKKPSERFASANELIAALRRVSDHTARIAAPPRDVAPIRAELTVVETRDQPRRVPLVALVVAGVVLVAVLPAVAIGLLLRPAEEPTVTALAPLASPVPAPLPPAAAPAHRVRVQIEVTPDDTTVIADGAPVDGHTIELPRDGARHRIELRAEDHEPRTIEVIGDVDRVVTVDLAPVSAAAAAEEPAPGARPTRARRAPARATKRRDPLMREW